MKAMPMKAMKYAERLRTHKLFGLKVLIRDALELMKQAQLPLVASSLAYTTILSIIPLLAVSFALFQAFGGQETINRTLTPFILNNLAEGVSDEVVEKLKSFISNAHGSAIGLGGLIGLIFTSMTMLFSIEKAINRVWHASMTRSLFQRISAYWLFITLGPLGLAVAVGFMTSSQIPLSHLFPTGTGAFLLTAAGFSAVYKWVPHTRVRTTCAGIAGIVIAAAFILAQNGFRLYTSRVVSYSKIYGSLAAVPILLLWIYIVWMIILSGAALTAALQKRADTLATVAPPEPAAGA
jgi:membrane protein